MKNSLVKLSIFFSIIFFTYSGLSNEKIVAGMIVGLSIENDTRSSVVGFAGTKSVKLLMTLYDGDKVYVGNPEQKVKIKINQKITVISSENSPFLIRVSGTGSSVFSKVVSWVERTVNENGVKARVINAASRGGGFDVRFLDSNRNQLVVRKKLNFEVVGGQAPYRMHVLNQAGQKIGSKVGIRDSAFFLDGVSLYPGNFSLVACDSLNCRIFPLSVESDRVNSEKTMASGDLNDLASEVVAYEIFQGLRYFQEGETSRLFEAYQILSEHKDSNELAEKILLSVN